MTGVQTCALPISTSSEKFGESVAFLDHGQVLLSGVSDSSSGKVVSYINKSDSSTLLADESTNTDFYDYNESETITATNLDNFGKVISASDNAWFAVAAPESDSNRGYVFTYKRNSITNVITVQQAFTSSLSATGKHGAALAISSDARWLYVGAPEDSYGGYPGLIYAYRLATGTAASGTVTGDGSTLIHVCPVSFDSGFQLKITDSTGKLYVYNKDYTISGSNIVFTTAPALNLVIIVSALSEYYYAYTAIVNNPGGATGDGFGSSLSTSADGTLLVVGVPGNDLSSLNNGKTVVYSRSVNAVLADSSTLTYTVLEAYTGTAKPRVTVDGTEVTVTSFSVVPSTSTTVVLANAPALGSEVVIETNNFAPIQTLYASDIEEGQAFGTSVQICADRSSIYVGSPNQDRNYTNNTEIGRAHV